MDTEKTVWEYIEFRNLLNLLTLCTQVIYFDGRKEKNKCYNVVCMFQPSNSKSIESGNIVFNIKKRLQYTHERKIMTIY